MNPRWSTINSGYLPFRIVMNGLLWLTPRDYCGWLISKINNRVDQHGYFSDFTTRGRMELVMRGVGSHGSWMFQLHKPTPSDSSRHAWWLPSFSCCSTLAISKRISCWNSLFSEGSWLIFLRCTTASRTLRFSPDILFNLTPFRDKRQVQISEL